jgi:hypothetical protein
LRQLNFGFRASFTLFAVVAIILFFAELSAFSYQLSALNSSNPTSISAFSFQPSAFSSILVQPASQLSMHKLTAKS